jgi:TRAP-type uncharacterized transport system substrate-binding protein
MHSARNEAVTTVAATALHATLADVRETEAARALRLVFENRDGPAVRKGEGAKISKCTGLRGIAMPPHPAAARAFGAPTPPGPAPGAERPG